MRLVLDTNVVASAMLWGGTPRLLLQARCEQRITLFTSLPLLAELSDILGRRKFDKKIAASLMSVDQLVDRYADLASVVRPVTVVGIAPDPDDDVVIGTAIAARAKLLAYLLLRPTSMPGSEAPLPRERGWGEGTGTRRPTELQ